MPHTSESIVDHHLTLWQQHQQHQKQQQQPSQESSAGAVTGSASSSRHAPTPQSEVSFLIQNSGMQDYDVRGNGTGNKVSLFGPGRISGGTLLRLPGKRSLGLSREMTYPHYLFLGGDNNGERTRAREKRQARKL